MAICTKYDKSRQKVFSDLVDFPEGRDRACFLSVFYFGMSQPESISGLPTFVKITSL